MSSNKIAVSYQTLSQKTTAATLARQLALPLVMPDCVDYPFLLMQTATKLQINAVKVLKLGPVSVNFISGKSAHRQQFGGGKGQLIAKAVGLKSAKKTLRILDATAGFGQDACVLANLGCSVLMLERSKIIAALLQDGLQRAHESTLFSQLDLKLKCMDAIEYLQKPQQFDVIYIDPMFPLRTQSALVKKEMQVIRQVVGDDIDVQQLLAVAIRQSAKRVVLKRNRYAKVFLPEKLVGQVMGKSTRYDIYTGNNDF